MADRNFDLAPIYRVADQGLPRLFQPARRNSGGGAPVTFVISMAPAVFQAARASSGPLLPFLRLPRIIKGLHGRVVTSIGGAGSRSNRLYSFFRVSDRPVWPLSPEGQAAGFSPGRGLGGIRSRRVSQEVETTAKVRIRPSVSSCVQPGRSSEDVSRRLEETSGSGGVSRNLASVL